MRFVCALILASLSAFAAVMAQPPEDAPKAGSRGRGPVTDRGGFRGAAGPLPERKPGRPVMLELLIADTNGAVAEPTAAKILDLEKSGKLGSGVHLRMATLEELPAFVKSSERLPRIMGSTTNGSRTLPIYNDTDVGITAQATMRFDDGGAVVQLFVERSRMAKNAIDEVHSDRFGPQSIATFTSQGTIRAKPGEWTMVGAGPSNSTGEAETWVVLLVTTP